MSVTTEASLDSRLTVRVRKVWEALAADGIPRRSQIDPKAFGADWANCFMIDLNSKVPQSRFTYVGNALRGLISVKFEGVTFSRLGKEFLVKIIRPSIPQVVADKLPVSFAGSAQHKNRNILYRTVLMPLSESGKQVDGIVAGAMYREVSSQQKLSW